MKNWKNYKVRMVDKEKGQRDDWYDTDNYVALLKQRNRIWNLPRKNDIYKASYTGELKEKFDLTYPGRPDYDAKPKALRVYTAVDLSHSDPASLPVRADKAARIIGHDILNALAFEKRRPCEYKDTSVLTDADAVRIYELACRENFKLDLRMPPEHTPQSIGLYVKDEDGSVPVIRTGYEVPLYRRLKRRVVNREAQDVLPLQGMFSETVAAMLEAKRGDNRDKQVTINVLEALLTAHNVTRLLARPEQWSLTWPMTGAGENREKQDKARAIFWDLMGKKSVDEYPTLLEYSKVTRNLKRFDHNAVTTPFFAEDGILEFFDEARVADDNWPPRHWNGGIHYYYWVGNLVRWMGDYLVPGGGGKLAAIGAYDYESWQKKIPLDADFVSPAFWANDGRRWDYWSKEVKTGSLRAQVQLRQGFNRGVRSQARFQEALEALAEFDEDLFVRQKG